MAPNSETVLVRVHSHRARRKLVRLIGADAGKSFFSFYREGEFWRIPAQHETEAKAITGITGGRDGDDLLPHMTLGARSGLTTNEGT